MKRYMLSIYQSDRRLPAPGFLDEVRRKLDALNRDLRAAGAWVFAGRLHPPNTATVVRVREDDVLMTDGPFAEAMSTWAASRSARFPTSMPALSGGSGSHAPRPCPSRCGHSRVRWRPEVGQADHHRRGD
jgi:hypothetical protein